MTLRLTADDRRALAELAEMEGVSEEEAAVLAIREAHARRVRQASVTEASAWGRERYADLLERLGKE